MTERHILPFPSTDGEDADIAARIAALYKATPATDAVHAERCARTVLAEAMHHRSRSAFGIPRARWWWGAAAAAVLVTATMRPWRGTETAREADSAFVNSTAAALQGSVTPLSSNAVRFDLQLPTAARAVAIVGDFNGWDERATPMARRQRDGSWSVNVPMSPGRHVYAFVVDGARWVVDPMAPQVPDEGYGPANAVMVEGLPK
ncbi:MAG: isoamylase early set domain-containing protein [Gemmatimonadaceae bacterium]|nr:isoamylase early set domain-containing protein [Gemmatimonadaceae bacterium]